MSDEIRVHLVRRKGRPIYMRAVDPFTGERMERSTETHRLKDAQKAAGKWEAELREGRYASPSKVTWPDFRDRYETEHVASLADKTAMKIGTVLDAVEAILSPQRLRDLTSARISHFQSRLREQGKPESTIDGYLRHLQAALSWAVTVGMLHQAPKITRPRRVKAQKVMKGRPITGEEFERMLAVVPKVVVAQHKPKKAKSTRKPKPKRAEQLHDARRVESWRHFLRGLWWSGLRLAEALELWWDRDDRLQVDLSVKRPMLRIPACLEKGNRDRMLPLAPEFAEFLLATPKADRVGRVFNPRVSRGDDTTAHHIGRIVSAIGKKAGVKVETHPETGKVKHASAHDLRRSFGDRWAKRVMPPVLMQLMRHENIETTLRHYTSRDAQATAEVLYSAIQGDTSGDTSSEPTKAEGAENTQTPAETGA